MTDVRLGITLGVGAALVLLVVQVARSLWRGRRVEP